MAERLRKEIGFVSALPLGLAADRKKLQLHCAQQT